LEGRAPGLHLPSYWDNDNFGQHTKGMNRRKRVLVSGVGDGGLIDALRFKYRGFDHATFARAVTRQPNLQVLKRWLLRIDRSAPAMESDVYFFHEYEKLNLPADLAGQFGQMRTDTELILNGTGKFPFSANASILHRLVAWSLMQSGELNYLQGRIERETITSEATTDGLRYWVTMPNGDQEAFDEVVLRHGPVGCLCCLCDIDNAFQGVRESAGADRTRERIYPEDFYPAAPRTTGPTFSPPIREIMSSNSTETGGPPLTPARAMSEPVMFAEPAGPELRPVAVPEFLELQLAIVTLQAELMANNFAQAQTASARVDDLLRNLDQSQIADLRQRALRALFEFELVRQEQVRAKGRPYDSTRLHELIERIEHGRD